MADVHLIKEVLSYHSIEAELTLHRDGEAMIAQIDRIDDGEVPCPDVVLLDLNLPRQNGEAVLRRMRESVRCSDTPIIIVSSSDAAKDRETTARLGASKYFHKSSDYDEFMQLGDLIREVVGTKGRAQ
jgi:DNA-binding response OmpR family regulator